MIHIGYACKAVAVPDTKNYTCRAAAATEEKLLDLISKNLKSINTFIDFNSKNDIRLFRICSDVIPFGSSPVNMLDWRVIFKEELHRLGQKAIQMGIRLSMHPGQYTILNSPNENVVERAIEDLRYHCDFLDSMGLSAQHKLILHIGGIYDNKEEAVERFCINYENLPTNIKDRLVIENDDRNYTIAEVYDIGVRKGIPVVFDNLHNELNPSDSQLSEEEWIEKCSYTWKEKDGRQKTHYSQQAFGKRPGAHSSTINVRVFQKYVYKLIRDDIDIMLEVKDKNQSAIKCINCVYNRDKLYLQEEWDRYQYIVMSRSYALYQELKDKMQDLETLQPEIFYQMLNEIINLPINKNEEVHTFEYLWKLLSDKVNNRDTSLYHRKMKEYKQGIIEESVIRKLIYRLALTYNETSLLTSYYFDY